MLFCACDKPGNDIQEPSLSWDELSDEQCITDQKFLFDGYHITQNGFDHQDSDQNSEISLVEAGTALTAHIAQGKEDYQKFFLGEVGELSFSHEYGSKD